MKVIHTELKNYNRRADNSVSFKCDSLIELSSKEIAEVDSHRGSVAVLVLTDALVGNSVDLNIDDILENLPENDLYDNYKTPSQRLRGALYVQLEQKLGRKPEKEEFADYYKRSMDAIISKVVSTLSPDM